MSRGSSEVQDQGQLPAQPLGAPPGCFVGSWQVFVPVAGWLGGDGSVLSFSEGFLLYHVEGTRTTIADPTLCLRCCLSQGVGTRLFCRIREQWGMVLVINNTEGKQDKRNGNASGLSDARWPPCKASPSTTSVLALAALPHWPESQLLPEESQIGICCSLAACPTHSLLPQHSIGPLY